MTELLTDDDINRELTELPGWERDGNAIVLTTQRTSFPAAIETVRAVADVAEQANHHPDIDIRYRTLTLRCSTHFKGGITEKDISLAREINRLLEE